MNLKLITLLVVLSTVAAFPTLDQLRKIKPRVGDKAFGLRESVTGAFQVKGFGAIQWLSNSEFLFRKDGNLYVLNVATNTETVFVTGADLQQHSTDQVKASADRTHLMILYDQKQNWRYSTWSKVKLYNVATKVFSDVNEGRMVEYATWTPSTSNLVYVYKNNIFHRLPNGIERSITVNGIEGVIFNGVPDWAYEEEIIKDDNIIWFSPDGTKLAYASINDVEVETYSMPLYGEPGSIADQYPTNVVFKFPKVGTKLGKISLITVDLTTSIVERVALPQPVEQIPGDRVLTTVAWANDEQVLAIWLNRRQNMGYLSLCTPAKGATASDCVIKGEINESAGWIDPVLQLQCTQLPDGPACLFLNNNNLWKHLVSVDITNGGITAQTTGNIHVLNIFGYHAATESFIYAATVDGNPEYKHVYQKDKCLSCDITGPDGEICRYATASFSNDLSHYALTCQGPSPSFTKLYKTEPAEEVRTFEDNAALRAQLDEYQEIKIHYVWVDVPNNQRARVKIFYPAEIDITNPTAVVDKYPAINYVYGAPNHVRVLDNFSIGFQNYLVTNRKIIYYQIDGRGSGNKGIENLFLLNNRMGTYEIEDQISVTLALQEMFPFIDKERTGIWGWSYGGYATSLVLSRDTDRVFQCGIAVAPATSWIYYDVLYTERYMGQPTEEDNLEGYIRGDVSQNVDEFANHDFLLIHGNADDNVHYQQAMSLSRALQRKNILFEQMSYPDEAHGLVGVLPHLYTTMDEFWVNCLNLDNSE